MQFNFQEQIQSKSDRELIHIIVNVKEYNPQFVQLAEEELQGRGIAIDKYLQQRTVILSTHDKRLQTPKSGSPLYIVLCFVLALLGGVIGIYAGYIYSESKVKSDSGDSYYVYDEQTRKLGKIMMYVGGSVIFIALLMKLFS